MTKVAYESFEDVDTSEFNPMNKYNKAYRKLPISAFFAMSENYACNG